MACAVEVACRLSCVTTSASYLVSRLGWTANENEALPRSSAVSVTGLPVAVSVFAPNGSPYRVTVSPVDTLMAVPLTVAALSAAGVEYAQVKPLTFMNCELTVMLTAGVRAAVAGETPTRPRPRPPTATAAATDTRQIL